MHKGWKYLGWTVVLFVVLCGMGGLTVGATGQSEQAAAPVMKGKISVIVGSWWEKQAPVVSAEFKKAYPNSDVEMVLTPWDSYLNSVTLAAMQPDAPDVMALDQSSLLALSSRGMLTDLGPLIAEHKLDKGQFFAGAWAQGELNGVRYGIPYRQSTYVLFYNPARFLEAGIDPNVPPKTWEDALAYAKKMTDASKTKYGIGIPASTKNVTQMVSSFAFVLWGFGGDFVDNARTKSLLDSPQAIKAAEYWTDLYLKYHVVPDGILSYNNDDVQRLFGAGNVAMIIGTDSAPVYFQKTAPAGFEYRTAIPPENISYINTWQLTIPKNAKNKEAAWTFVQWFTRPDVLPEITVRMPAVKSAVSSPKWSDYAIYLQAGDVARSFPVMKAWPKIQEILADQLQNILVGKTTVEKGMRAAADLANAELKK